jgi:23S rRNA (adenine2503-C2)-methyltransferase
MTVNLLDFNQAQLAEYFAGLGEKPFRAKQLMRWMHHFGENDFAQMTDIAKTLREKLALEAAITPPVVQLEQVSDDGTRKWLIGASLHKWDVHSNVLSVPRAVRGSTAISACLKSSASCGWRINRCVRPMATICCRLVSVSSAMSS